MSGIRRRTERLTWSKKTGKAFNHGTTVGYNIHGCRCDECWEAWSTSAVYKKKLEIRAASSDKAARR